MENKKSENERISWLIDTSVQDMQSGLWGYNDVDFLKKALDVVEKRGEKTKAKVLKTRIRKLEKKHASL